ncbi:restriction endonuclease subunit S [Haloarcula sediminis]|uniref:restriction endonuclease subunit S n=1 Tax=Haloarcula sediminis TaxID=3111777 RepID=UPI002D78B27F|nr:restriction endonuclease subunit S [Haloarcula sp. CK38]
MSESIESEVNEPRDGYKQVQLGPKEFSIPEEWRVRTVAEVTENLDRQREPIKSSNRENGDVPYYGATGQIDSVSGHIFDEKLVLIGEDGADWSPFGGTAYIIEGKSWVNNHVHVLRATDVVEEYLAYFFEYVDMRHVISGTNRGKLNQGELNSFPVLTPPIPEQQRIAAVLSILTEEIDQTERLIETAEELKQGFFQDIYLSPEHGATTTKKPKNVPDNWDVKKLDELCEIGGGSTPKRSNPEYWNGDTPWCSPKEFDKRGIIEETEDQVTQEGINEAPLTIYPANSTLVPVRSNVIKRRLPIGKITIPSTINQDLKALVPDEEQIDPEYLFQVLHYNSERIRLTCRKSGTTIDSIDTTALSKYEIMVPELQKQRYFSQILSTIDKKIKLEEHHKQKLEELRRGLMQDLLTGAVRTPTGLLD